MLRSLRARIERLESAFYPDDMGDTWLFLENVDGIVTFMGGTAAHRPGATIHEGQTFPSIEGALASIDRKPDDLVIHMQVKDMSREGRKKGVSLHMDDASRKTADGS